MPGDMEGMRFVCGALPCASAGCHTSDLVRTAAALTKVCTSTERWHLCSCEWMHKARHMIMSGS